MAAEAAFLKLQAEGQIDPERHRLYTDLMFHALGAKATQAVEALMQGGYEPQSELAKGWKAEGKAEGLKQGQAEGKAEGEAAGKAAALLAVLAARQLPVSEAQRAAILACRDQTQLDRWIARAATASSAEAALA